MTRIREVFADYINQSRWVAWSNRDGVKVPINPWHRHMEPASSTNPTTWGPADRAVMMVRQFGLDGIGFILLPDDDVVGIDLDDCRNEITGMLEPWAEDIVQSLASYAEVSPSGTGVKIWARAPSLERAYKDNRRGIEIYPHSRYFTVTGKHLATTPPAIVEADEELMAIIDEYFDQSDSLISGMSGDDMAVDVSEWAEDALSYIHPDGGVDGDYDGWIKVGQALHHETDGGADGLALWDAWSQRSQHYDAEELAAKWHSFGSHGSPVTAKSIWYMAEQAGWVWQPEDYSDWDGFTDGGAGEVEDEEDGGAVDGDGKSDQPRRSVESLMWLDASELYRDDSPYEPDLIEGILGAGDVCMIFGPPKSMKSMVTLAACRQWAAGREWMGIQPQRPLKIAYLNLEVKEDQLRKRLKLASLDREHVDAMAGRLMVSDRTIQTLSATMVSRMEKSLKAADRVPDEPWDLLVIDPLVDLFNGDNENDNKQTKDFINGLKSLASRLHHDCALWLVHHANKTKRKEREDDPFNSLRGGSALRGAYDTGIALGWESESREVLKMFFECRNSAGYPARRIRFDGRDGKFHLIGEIGVSKREASEKVVSRHDREAGRQARVICDILKSEAAEMRFYTDHSFADKFCNDPRVELGSSGSIRRRIGELFAKEVLGYFDAGDYGGEDKHHRSKGHICCLGMAVGHDPIDDKFLTVEEAEGVVVEIKPRWVFCPGSADPVDKSETDFESLKLPEFVYQS